MALAIGYDRLLVEGAVSDQAALARLAHVSRARVSQIMGLLNLTPDLQEQVLFLPRTLKGRDRFRLADLLAIASILDWRTQRRRWRARAGDATTPRQPRLPNQKSHGVTNAAPRVHWVSRRLAKFTPHLLTSP